MATFCDITFTAANGTALTALTGETGTPLSLFAGGTDGVVFSNRGRSNAAGSTFELSPGVPATAEYYVEGQFYVASNAGILGLIGRFVNTPSQRYYLLWHNGGVWTLYLYNGGFTSLGTYTQALTVGQTYTVKLELLNATKKVFIDGVQRISSSDNTATAIGQGGLYFGATATDSTSYHLDRLTMADAGPLTSGVSSFTGATTAAISLSCTAAVGGTGPYTYQWYRSTTSGFTPGGGNILSGATSLTLTDSTGLTAGVNYFYKLVATDAIAGTVTSSQVTAQLWSAALSLGFIGDSITDGAQCTTRPGTVAAGKLATWGALRPVTATNQGVGGSGAGAWVSGSANLIAAKTAFAAAGVTHVHIMIGTNDGLSGNSAAGYLANVTSMVNDLVAASLVVILSDPPGFGVQGLYVQGTESHLATLLSYSAQLDTLPNGTTIFRGDKLAMPWFAGHPSELSAADGIHFKDGDEISNDRLALFWAVAIKAVLTPAGGGGGGTGARVIGG